MTPSTPSPTPWHSTNANITASDVKYSQSYPLTLHKSKHYSQWRQVLPVLHSDTPQTQTSQPVTSNTHSPTLWHSTNANITASDVKYSQSYPLTLHKRKHRSQWRQVLPVLPSDTPQTQTSQPVTSNTHSPTFWHSTNANITTSDVKYSHSYPLTLHKRKHHSQWRQVLPSDTPQTQTSQPVTSNTHSPTLWHSTNANITASDVKYSQSYPLTLHKRKHHSQWRQILPVLPSDTPQMQTSQPVMPSSHSPTLWHSTNANITASDANYWQSYPLTLNKRKHHSQWRQIL